MQESDTAKAGGIFLVHRSCFPSSSVSMDVLANHSIFQELQLVHDTGYFSAMPSLEENWQQVRLNLRPHRRAWSAQCARRWAHARSRHRRQLSALHKPHNHHQPTTSSSKKKERRKQRGMCAVQMQCSLSLTQLTIFPEMAKWIRCERTPARNKAVRCDLGKLKIRIP